MIKLAKVKAELSAFYFEIFVENKPRYKQPTQWPHLWVDFWVAFFDMSYTLGHIVGIGIPVYLIWKALP